MTILARGDVAVVGYDFGTNDSFSVVLLRAVDTAHAIKFTENSAAIDNTLGSYAEGNIVWTPPSNLAAGTVVTFSESSTEGLFNVFIGGVGAGTAASIALETGNQFWSSSSSGDQVFVYQGDPGPNAAGALVPTYLFGLHLGADIDGETDPDGDWDATPVGTGGGSSYRPDVLDPNKNGGTAYSVGFYDSDLAADVNSAGAYSGPTTAATAAVWTQRIADPLNWTFSASLTNSAGANGFSSTAFTISSPSAAPTLDINTGSTVAEGGIDVVTASELQANDTDTADTALVFTVSSTPTNGSLWVDADNSNTINNAEAALGVGGTFTQQNVNDGRLKYAHNGGETLSAGFGFSVTDGSTPLNGNTFNFTVTPVNDAPVVANIDGDVRSWSETTGVNVGLDQSTDATVSDVDTANFDTGAITVSFGATGQNEDRLVVASIGLVASGGGFVLYNGDVVGSLSGGTNGTSLVITLTSANIPVTATVVQDILRAIQYGNTAGDAPNAGARSLTLTLTDGDGGLSNISTVTVNVAAADDPPVAVDDAATVDENGTVSGDLTAANPTTPDSDPDGPAFVIAAVNGSGANVGGQIALASGALLTVAANGSFTYDPNHAFDATPDFASSGASNATATDSFTYTLAGGGTATVTLTVRGVDSADTLQGTLGADTLAGGTGNDIYVNPTAADTILEAAGAGGGAHDAVRSAISYNLSAAPNVEDVTLSGAANVNALGNNFANILTGNSGNNVLNGGGGIDTLTGGAGNDLMNGGNGADLFRFAAAGTGADRIAGFSLAQDRFDLSGGTFTDLNYSGGDTVLTHAGGTIRIEGIVSLNLAQWRGLIVSGVRATSHDADSDAPYTGRFTAPAPDPAFPLAAHADFLFG